MNKYLHKKYGSLFFLLMPARTQTLPQVSWLQAKSLRAPLGAKKVSGRLRAPKKSPGASGRLRAEPPLAVSQKPPGASGRLRPFDIYKIHADKFHAGKISRIFLKKKVWKDFTHFFLELPFWAQNQGEN